MQSIIKLSALLAFAVFCGCKDSNTTQIIYTNDGKPGTIVGKVALIDSTYAYLKDASGVEVTIEGTPYKAVTDSNGKWSITNVLPGTYYLFFKKDGFALKKDGAIKFAGNGTDSWNSSLYRINRITPDLILRPFEEQSSLSYRDTVVYDSLGRPHSSSNIDTIIDQVARFTFILVDKLKHSDPFVVGQIFLSKTNNISPLDPKTYLYTVYTNFSYPISTSSDLFISRKGLLDAGFSTDDKIFCVLYAAQQSFREGYIDSSNDKYIYTGFSPFHSEVKSFILP